MNIIFSKQAEKFMLSQGKKQAQRIKNAVELIPVGDIRRLEGKNLPLVYRLRVGNYRVIYLYDGDEIKIVKVDNRGDVYK